MKLFKLICITSFFICITLFANASSKITGRVTNTHGIPLSGVNVSKDGEINGTVTDQQGNFSFEIESLPVVLCFRNPGFSIEKREFQDEQTNKDIVLINDVESKNVAFGQLPKDQMTASFYSISGEELVTSGSTNLLLSLQGRLPGFSVMQIDGSPGNETFSTKIRGTNTPNSNTVLYIVDGVERDASQIDPYEVESVTVLKDAAATAMYGMRGSGGVLLINTKKGFVGKSKIDVSIVHALQAPTRLPKFVSAFDYAKMYNQGRANDTLFIDAQDIAGGGSGVDHRNTAFYTPDELERYQKGDMTEFYPSRNMTNDFIKDFSQFTKVNVNFQGGSEKVRYFTSVGYLNQEGLFESEVFDRYSYDSKLNTNRFNFRANLDVSLNENLKVWANVGGYMEKNNSPYIGNGLGLGDVMRKIFQTPNNAYNNLTPEGEVLVKRDKLTYRNTNSAYGDLNRTGSILETSTYVGNTFGVIHKLDFISKGLSTTAQFAFDAFSINDQIRSRTYEAWEVASLSDINGLDTLGFKLVPNTTNSALSDGQNKFFNYLLDTRISLDYQRTFGEAHNITGMLMVERFKQQQQDLLATNFLSLVGRVSYAFKNKYYTEINFAYQGNEQFVKGKRFGLFPSVSAGWLVSNENFLQNNNTLSYLKLRASAGQTGNSTFAYGSGNQYLYLTSWSAGGVENQIGNPDITWETYTEYNVGLDVELFNSLSLSTDYYYNNNTDIILTQLDFIPQGMLGLSGAVFPPVNAGKVINRGFEIAAGYNKQLSKKFEITFNGNVSFNKNELKSVKELPYDETYAYSYRREGYPIGYLWGYKTDGLFNSQNEIESWADQSALGGVPIPGDIKYLDLNGDDAINEKDMAPLGNQNPGCIFGLNTRLKYKWFDLNIFLNGVSKRNVRYIGGIGRWSITDNFTDYMKESWTAEKAASGQQVGYPRLGNNSTNYIFSDYWIENGSYLRLRNLELGFTLPDNISNRIHASSVRLYFNGLNLFVWDKLPNNYLDPEAADYSNILPIMKAYNVGLSLKF